MSKFLVLPYLCLIGLSFSRAEEANTSVQGLESKTEWSKDDIMFLEATLSSKVIKPSEIKNKIDTYFDKKKSDFQKESTQKRDTSNSVLKSQREEFLKQQKSKREEFFKNEQDPIARQKLTEDQKNEREQFFGNQQKNKNELGKVLINEKKSQDEYIKKFKSYIKPLLKKYENEYLANEALQKSMLRKKPIPGQVISEENKNLLEEFKKIPKTKGEVIGPE